MTPEPHNRADVVKVPHFYFVFVAHAANLER